MANRSVRRRGHVKRKLQTLPLVVFTSIWRCIFRL